LEGLAIVVLVAALRGGKPIKRGLVWREEKI
jgi:hypothetical protein